jgi:hypothetical protein
VRNDLLSGHFGAFGQKTAVRSIRVNSAAWVAGPSRICFFTRQAAGWPLISDSNHILPFVRPCAILAAALDSGAQKK